MRNNNLSKQVLDKMKEVNRLLCLGGCSCFLKRICPRGDCKIDIAEDDCLMYTSFLLMSHSCPDMLANVNPRPQ